MPGRIDMDQQGAVGSLDLKKDRSHAQIAQPAPAVQEQAGQPANGLAQPHGQNGALPNGVAGHDAMHPTTNGETKSPSTVLAGPSNPPPLDQSWREQESNKSFGKLLTRVSHQCFVDLHETISSMNAVQEETQRPHINGALQPAHDTSEASLKKKRMLMEFANNQRDRFIKTLVLADVSRNQEDQARMIDVKVWQSNQNEAYGAAMGAIGMSKLKMMDFKIRSPNIEGAMETLSTGKSSRTPHLGYIAPKKASAKELLKTLRDMNVILATRLSLNDELSPHMQEYSIANGRVTFTVPGEFELDLSVGDDDPESQFFFLDFRLAFKPSTGAISDIVRTHLESKVNQALMNSGLPGCYDVLHSFVLTHKVNVLRSQVSELTQSKWFDCIRGENMRRSLTVQYWTGRPGPKSWIEVGISSGKIKGVRTRKTATPCLSVRWFRRGAEVKDESLNFDWSDLSLERCLSTVIEKHTSWILDDLRSRIQDLIPAEVMTGVQASGDSSSRKALSLSLRSIQTSLRIQINAVTGQYSISPPSNPTARAERYLNSDPAADPAQWFANTLCAVAQEKVHKTAELLQWTPVPRLARQENLQKIFGSGVRAHSTFLPRKAWGEHWALAVTFSLSGETWWAVSLEDKHDDQGNVVGRIIVDARRIRRALDPTANDAVSRAALLHVERSAVVEVAFAALSAQLKDLRIPHHFEQIPRPRHSEAATASDAPKTQTALFFLPSKLLKPAKNKHDQTWTKSLARLTHHGMIDSGAGRIGVRFELRVALEKGKLSQLQKHLTNFKDRNLVLKEDRGVALRIVVPFGKPCAEQIRSRLQSIERLDHYVRALQKYGLQCTHVSLSRLSFTYNKDADLSAILSFPSEDGRPILLKLQPSDISPHARIRVLLEAGLNETGDIGVEAMGFILLLTLPLLQAFERVEKSNSAKHTVSVQPQTSTRYLLKYSAPLPTCTFEIRSRLRREGKKKVAFWHVQLRRNGAALPDNFTEALSQELWQDKGEHWQGVGNGITTNVLGIGSAIDKLDATVRRFETSVSQAPRPTAALPANPQVESQAKENSQPQASSSQQQPQQQRATNTKDPTPTVKKEQPDVIMLD